MRRLREMQALPEVLRVLRLEGEALLECADRIERTPAQAQAIDRALARMVAALESGGKIVVTGLGKSGKVGQKIAATLCSTGSLAVFLHPTEGLHGDLGVLTSKDVVLALSQTGNTDELVRLLPSFQTLRVPVVCISGNGESRLAQMSDAWLDSTVKLEACPHNLAPTTSTTLALAWGDALAVALMKLRGFDAQSFAQNHPGGSIGRKLSLRVGDVMHAGSKVATLPPTATMDEVVLASTRGKLGAVLIVELAERPGSGSKLLGIVTDGDLRRALSHREKFFAMRASEVMTSSPITIGAEAMAAEALTLMEDRKSQISVLPVVDALGNWQGLVRLHDLFTSF